VKTKMSVSINTIAKFTWRELPHDSDSVLCCVNFTLTCFVFDSPCARASNAATTMAATLLTILFGLRESHELIPPIAVALHTVPQPPPDVPAIQAGPGTGKSRNETQTLQDYCGYVRIDVCMDAPRAWVKQITKT
jgi:hypothetical protein